MNPIATELVRDQVAAAVEEAVARTPVSDIHTHLYDPAFGKLLLWGVDELLTYHYLVSESFRYLDLPFEKFCSSRILPFRNPAAAWSPR
jgi:hypothetical protein